MWCAGDTSEPQTPALREMDEEDAVRLELGLAQFHMVRNLGQVRCFTGANHPDRYPVWLRPRCHCA